jgi:hypothetical protein
MGHLPNADVLLASAGRFLVDGGEEDAASVLLACSLSAWPSGDTFYVGDETHEALHVELIGPRAAYDALMQEDEPVPTDEDGEPFPMPEEYWDNLPLVVRPVIQKAIEAVLPSGFYIKHLTIHADLVDIDPDWRTELLEIARGKGVHNQAVMARTPHIWQNLNFRSRSEIRIAQALDKAKVLFMPNCRSRLGTSADVRVNREADFLVCHEGRWGILEVDGEPFHPPERTAQEHERDRLFRTHGLRVVEHFDATRCYEQPDAVVREFLGILAQS